MALTGNGATFALATIVGGGTAPSSVGRVISIGELKFSGEEISDDDLASTLKEYCAGDLTDVSQLTLSVVFDQNIHMAIAASNLNTPYDATLTFQLPDGLTTPGNIAGSGFLVEAGSGDQENDARVETSLVWRFDNKSTPVAFTAAV